MSDENEARCKACGAKSDKGANSELCVDCIIASEG